MLTRRQAISCVLLVLWFICQGGRASADYHVDYNLNYDSSSDLLSGYAVTWKDWWEPDSDEYCAWWGWDEELGDYCGDWVYEEYRADVSVALYEPSGSLYGSGSIADWSRAELDLNPFTPTANGTWTQNSTHSRLVDQWETFGTETWYYVGQAPDSSVQVSTQVSNSCGDGGLDALVTEYRNRTYNTGRIPRCEEFRLVDPNAVVSTYFTWGDVNHPEDNTHGWAIVAGTLLYGLDGTQYYYQTMPSGSAIRITAGYRCPHINYTLPGSSTASLHMVGRSADMKPLDVPPGQDLDYATWSAVSSAAWAAGATSIESWERDHSHVHADWNN